MRNECSEYQSQYIYHCSAYAIAGEFYRPVQRSLPVQGGTVLAVTGGYSSQHIGRYCLDDLVSFENAYVEVGGSYDQSHDTQTSYFCSVIEGLNVMDMLTADRVVARMMVYSPKGDHGGEHTFDITGSYFDNVKIAGRRIDAKLDTGAFHRLNSFSKFYDAYARGQADDLLVFSNFNSLQDPQLADLEGQYHPLCGLSSLVNARKTDTTRKPQDYYLCSALNHLDFKRQVEKDSELQGYGAVICIPKFGVIRLGEILIYKYFRSLTMFTVQMGSTASSTVTGGQGSTGGGNGLP